MAYTHYPVIERLEETSHLDGVPGVQNRHHICLEAFAKQLVGIGLFVRDVVFNIVSACLLVSISRGDCLPSAGRPEGRTQPIV
jgi:hypothetical protein